MQIKNLFDPAKNIYRTIEKVITYNASQEARLKAEIGEYIVTESIEEQFDKLLRRMQAAMEMGGTNEVGVWVSGFYGSGKSSFTKYLGLALDDGVQVDGTRFLKHLQDRLNKPQTKALLSTVASRYPAAVVLLDLASEMLAGATMEDVSTVLYYKALQWAGYSRNLKVAALERRLQKDGRYPEFLDRVQADSGMAWKTIQNDPLVIDSLLPEIAHALYPELFRTSGAFTAETKEFVQSLKDQVEEMLDIVRRVSGKPYVLFIVDEVGQYVSNRQNLILNLQGLAENLKNVGNGKAWIVGTAQQTLTEDDPKAAFNSPELYKLKDRFPIQVNLESSDIKEICYRRLLGKSQAGEEFLGDLFDKHGQALRHNTRLQDARYYDSDFNKTEFANLYPFLPAHFDILLHLLGALARSTGGIGLRSAIKVIQDILIEGPDGHTPVADQPAGWLATSVTLYDALERDIRNAEPSVHKGVGKALIRFPHSPVHQDVAKTVAILHILKNLPVTAQNVTSLMHPGVAAPSRRDEVDAAIQDLMADAFVPFGEKDGNLCFFSEKINDIDLKRAALPGRSTETRRIQNEALREAFNPLPAVHLHNSLGVTSGLKMAGSTGVSSLAGEHETIQTLVEFADPANYDAVRAGLIEESRQRGNQNAIYLLGRISPEVDERTLEIYRSREIVQLHRNDPDQEVKDYCNTQTDRANRLASELERLLQRQLAQGSFIFRGQPTAVESLDPDLREAARKHLGAVAGQVFDRYGEAPLRADTSLAERFLRAGNLRAVTAAIDPLGLVQVSGGTPRINASHKALLSIRDYLDRNGTVDGKRLIDTFTSAPFGWSQDTLRYLVAALLVGGEIKLKVSGREVTVNGQHALDALRTNNSFKPAGVMLRSGENRPAPDVLARAAQRLTGLIGDTVIPLEDEIGKAATQHFPYFQQRYGSLAVRLENLGLPGADRAHALSQDITDVLQTDGSDVPRRLGAEPSPLCDNLIWAAEVDMALNNGLDATVRKLQRHRQEIGLLPDSGAPGQLRAALAEELEMVGQRLSQDTFYTHGASLNAALTAIQARTRDAVGEMANALKATVNAAQAELARTPGWNQVNQDRRNAYLGQLDELGNLAGTAPRDLIGLRQLLNQEYVIQSRVRDLRPQIISLMRPQVEPVMIHDGHYTRNVTVPASIRSVDQLDRVIEELQCARREAPADAPIRITITITRE